MKPPRDLAFWRSYLAKAVARQPGDPKYATREQAVTLAKAQIRHLMRSANAEDRNAAAAEDPNDSFPTMGDATLAAGALKNVSQSVPGTAGAILDAITSGGSLPIFQTVGSHLGDRAFDIAIGNEAYDDAAGKRPVNAFVGETAPDLYAAIRALQQVPTAPRDARGLLRGYDQFGGPAVKTKTPAQPRTASRSLLASPAPADMDVPTYQRRGTEPAYMAEERLPRSKRSKPPVETIQHQGLVLTMPKATYDHMVAQGYTRQQIAEAQAALARANFRATRGLLGP